MPRPPLPTALLLAMLLSATAAAQFGQPSYTATQTFLDDPALSQTRMNIAFDGTEYWSCSGGGSGGIRLARFDAMGVFQSDYSPGIDFRSVWTENDTPPVYGKGCSGAQMYVQTSPGTFVPDVVLTGAPMGCQEAVVFDGNGDFIALQDGAGIVHTWARATGVLLGSVPLSGYGTMFGEAAYPAARGIAWAGGFYLTYSNLMLSAWDPATGMRVGTTTLTGAGMSFDSHFSYSYANGLFWVIDGVGGMWRGYDVGLSAGARCSLTTPASPSSADVVLPISLQSSMTPTVDVSFDYSTDAGATWQPCTAAPTSSLQNPQMGVAVGMDSFTWDTLTDAVGLLSVATCQVRATVDDGVLMMPRTCQTQNFDVDNVLPAPTCTLVAPPGTLDHDIDLALDALSVTGLTVDLFIEYSDDGGATWNPATAAPGSPVPNPAVGQMVGSTSFLWDSAGDGVGAGGLVPGIVVRATISDPMYPTLLTTCQTVPFDVDNSSLCGGICGDCDLGGTGPDVLDALSGAQIAAGLFAPMGAQLGCCDVDASGAITVIDALGMAQAAAGLPVVLTCL